MIYLWGLYLNKSFMAFPNLFNRGTDKNNKNKPLTGKKSLSELSQADDVNVLGQTEMAKMEGGNTSVQLMQSNNLLNTTFGNIIPQ
jgi:hypothetical protein